MTETEKLRTEVNWLWSVLTGVKATLEMAVPIDGAEAVSEALIYEVIDMIEGAENFRKTGNVTFTPGITGELYIRGEKVGTAVLTGTEKGIEGTVSSYYHFSEIVVDSIDTIRAIDDGATLHFVEEDKDHIYKLATPVVVGATNWTQEGDRLRGDHITILSPVYRKKLENLTIKH